MEWIGVVAGVVGTLVAAAALYFSRSDRQGDKLEALTARIGRLETQMEPFWAAVQADMIKILHHPWPERHDMDELLDKLDPDKPGTLAPDEREKLRDILRRVIAASPGNPPPFRVSPDERVAAVFLLRTMDLVGGK